MLIAENSTCIHTGHTKIHNTIDMTLYIIQNRVTYTCNTSIYLPHNLGEKESSTPGKYIYIYRHSTLHKRKVEVDCSKNTELTSTPPLGRVEAPRVPSVEDLNKNVYSYLFLHLH